MDNIEALLKEKGLTKTAFSDLLGIKKQNLNGLMKNPTLETIKKICICFRCSYVATLCITRRSGKRNQRGNVPLLRSTDSYQNNNRKGMSAIDIIRGILIYMYGQDHNPPHLHIKDGGNWFTITIKDRMVEGKGTAKTIRLINEYIDAHEAQLLEIWEKAQNGEKIEKVKR